MSSNGRRGWRLATWAVVFALLVAACDSGGDGDESQESGPVELTLLDHQKPRVDLLRKLLP
jgi:hypothetical protein